MKWNDWKILIWQFNTLSHICTLYRVSQNMLPCSRDCNSHKNDAIIIHSYLHQIKQQALTPDVFPFWPFGTGNLRFKDSNIATLLLKSNHDKKSILLVKFLAPTRSSGNANVCSYVRMFGSVCRLKSQLGALCYWPGRSQCVLPEAGIHFISTNPLIVGAGVNYDSITMAWNRPETQSETHKERRKYLSG